MNLPVFLFITPMFLFAGTFFPLENLPLWAQWTAAAMPLSPSVNLARGFSCGRIGASDLTGLAYLAVFAAAVFPMALHRMRRRLIK